MENKFAVIIFFSLLGIIATTVFSSILMNQNRLILAKLSKK